MRVILCFLLALVAAPAWAEWVKVSENKDATFYIDPATIRKDGNFRRVREMQDLKKRDNDGELSLQSLEEYDCKEKRNRTLAFATHSDPKGGGKVLYSTNSSDKWSSIPPSTPALVILNRVCAKQLLPTGIKVSCPRKAVFQGEGCNVPVDWAQSFFSSLKSERRHGPRYSTPAAAEADLFGSIESFYNRRRKHSPAGHASPMKFLGRWISAQQVQQLAA